MPLRTTFFRMGVFLLLLAATPTAWSQNFSQLFERGFKAQENGRDREAIAAYEAALKVGDPNDINYEIACSNLGQMYNAVGQLDRAETLLTTVLTKRQARLNPNDELIGRILANLSGVYYSQGRLKESIKARERSIDIYRLHYTVEQKTLLVSLESLFNLYMATNQGDKAEALTRLTIQQLEARVGPNDGRLQSSLLNLARLAVNRGRYREANQLIERARRMTPPGDRKIVAPEVEGTLVVLYHSMGRYAEALEMQREMLRKMPEYFAGRPERDELIYAGWASQGDLLLELGQIDEAVRLLAAATNAREAKQMKHPAPTLQSLAHGYERLGQLDKAEQYYRRVMTDKNAPGGNRAYCGQLLAAMLIAQGKTVEPEELLLNGIKHCETYDMLQMNFCANIRRSLGDLYLLNRRLIEAESQLRMALSIFEKDEGQHYTDEAASWMGLAQVFDAQHKTVDCLQAADVARRKLHELTVKVLPLLAESQQTMFLAADDGPNMQKALALVRAHADDQQAVDFSAAWILNRKGLAQEVMAERLLLSREARDPALAALVDDWVAVRHQLANVTVASGSAPGTRQELVEELTQREQELARQLGQAKLRQTEPSPWHELWFFRKALAKSSIYVDMVRYLPDKIGAKPVYLVWLVPPADEGDVKLIELSSAAEVDQAIAALRKQLNVAPNHLRLKRGLTAIDQPETAQDKEQFRRSLDRVGQTLLDPLLPTLSRFDHWIICPDGAPWLVPWSALPLKSVKNDRPQYVVEKHRVSFTTSGRDLLDKPSAVSDNPALVLADPDFDHASQESAPAALPVSPSPSLSGGLATRSADKMSGNWTALPGTAAESRLLAPALTAYTRHAPQMFLQAQASEATFKAAWRPRVAVFSTHGFFLNPTAGGLGKDTSSQNPLLRCGLVLSGANQPRARTQNAEDDGIVTGLDVLETDLRGTELVVLSACETAIGQISASEGVAGLRQAFQLSGARSVVATLWRIPDAETAQLMKTFFDRLAAGADKATALQQAQLSLLAPKGKAATDTSHPFFWAAFTLTGDWRVPEVGKPEPRPGRRLPGAQVEVVVESAPLMKDDAVVLTVARGDHLTSGKVKGDWIEIFYEPGTTKTAWIHKSKVRDVK